MRSAIIVSLACTVAAGQATRTQSNAGQNVVCALTTQPFPWPVFYSNRHGQDGLRLVVDFNDGSEWPVFNLSAPTGLLYLYDDGYPLPQDYFDPTPVPCTSPDGTGTGACAGTVIAHGHMKFFPDLVKWAVYAGGPDNPPGFFPCARQCGSSNVWCGSCLVLDLDSNTTAITQVYANEGDGQPSTCGCDQWMPANMAAEVQKRLPGPTAQQRPPESGRVQTPPLVPVPQAPHAAHARGTAATDSDILCTLANQGALWPVIHVGRSDGVIVEYSFNDPALNTPWVGVAQVILRVVDVALASPNSTFPADTFDAHSNTFYVYVDTRRWAEFAQWDLFANAGKNNMPCMRLADDGQVCATCFVMNTTSGSTAWWHLLLDPDGAPTEPPSTCGCSAWAPAANASANAHGTAVTAVPVPVAARQPPRLTAPDNATCAFVPSPAWWPVYNVGKPEADGVRMRVLFGPDNPDYEPLNDTSPYAEILFVDDTHQLPPARVLPAGAGTGYPVPLIQAYVPFTAWNDWAKYFLFANGADNDFPCARMTPTPTGWQCATCFVYDPATNAVALWSQSIMPSPGGQGADACGCKHFLPPA